MLYNRANFLIPELPVLDPRSPEYIDFWKDQKRKCIEGMWAGGFWCPPTVYHYGNYSSIDITDGKIRKRAKAELRDLEWEKGKVHAVMRGFSGFENDLEFTCNHTYKELGVDPKGRKYMDPLEYLDRWFKVDLGKAKYENPNLNLIDMEARGTGKSFWAANLISHYFLYDGATDYDLYLHQRQMDEPMNCEIIVGSVSDTFTDALLLKVEKHITNLPGSQERNGRLYPSPLSTAYAGQFDAKNKSGVVKGRNVKKDGKWKFEGSGTQILVRNFAVKKAASSGSRAMYIAIEECGLDPKLDEVFENLKDVVNTGTGNFGSMHFFGTGGEVAAGRSQAAKRMFTKPDLFDCLHFKDKFGTKIGYTVPAYKKYNEFRDDNGIIDTEKARTFYNELRKTQEADTRLYYGFIQNNPDTWEEMFLVPGGNRFPGDLLQKQRTALQISTNPREIGMCGELSEIGADGKVTFTPDLENRLKPASYPVDDKNNKDEGCVVIFEFPDDDLINVEGAYIAGLDPYDHDDASSSTSLGSIIVFKSCRAARYKKGIKTEVIVAEYTGRPKSANDFYEISLRLLCFYNAKVLYENEKILVKAYYQKKGFAFRFAATPNILRASVDASVKNRNGIGINMTADIKREAEDMLREYFTESVIAEIKSIPILSEAIDYNASGNFDRMIALMLVIIYNLQIKTDDGDDGQQVKNDLLDYLRERANPRKHSGNLRKLIQR
ncbi:MAG: hypothetical protein EBU90_01535 [Proteobacteria bacterium]|nr:hypothetical protein [Pseudomonadota bacterium]